MRLRSHLAEDPDADLADIAYSLATARSAREQRAVAVGEDRGELLAGLAALAEGRSSPAVIRGADAGERRAVFLFPGQGGQWPGMASELRRDSPVFARHLDDCEQALEPYVDWSLSEVLGERDSARLDRLDIVQPTLLMVMIALAKLWRDCGVRPAAVVGHSQGEIAATHIGGGLSLDDAARIVALHSQASVRLVGKGGMASVSLPLADLSRRLEPFGDSLALAAVNGPASAVVSGGPEALRELLAGCEEDGVRAQPIAVDYAAHSVQIESLRGELLEAFHPISPRSSEVPFHSTLTGEQIDTALLGPEYWYRNLRETVRLEPVIRSLLEAGQRSFIEIGPHPVLAFGLRETADAVLRGERATVLGSLRRDEGSRRFAISLAEAHVAGLAVDWDALYIGTAAKRVPLPIDTEPVEAAAGVSRDGAGAEGDLAAALANLPRAERRDLVLSLVRGETAAVLGDGAPDSLDDERSFKELGFDSLLAVELCNRLATASGLDLPTTTIFDYPTASSLADFIEGRASGVGSGQADVVVADSAANEAIAIVGMACRFPGVATTQQLWGLLAAGGDAIGGFPSDRGWDLERLYHPDPDRPRTSYAREGGFLAEATEFDAAFFGIGPREALAMDPQQRLLLEVCWEACEAAGLDPASLHGSRTGVFTGISSQDYSAGLRAPEDAMEGFVLTGSFASVASGRVAYSLGLEGPAITVDTACSSSLVALHLAAQALRGGECPLALAGGATVLSSPGMFTEFSRQRGLAPDGRSKAFARAADGVGFAEGVGVLAVERLSDAERNGHPVLAVIRGSAVNQDGASNGLTAPNGPSQQRVIRQALANAGIEAKDVDAVEAHGTGTTLGDPIEAQALLATYGQGRDNGPLKLGALKSNIGHTQAAAGVAGVIKMVLAMREGVLPKTLHVDAPSPHVDWDSGAVELLTEAEPWEPNGHPRRAGVSSFGISGTNAHLILEEAPAAEPGGEVDPGESGGAGAPGEDSVAEPEPEPAPLPGQVLLPLSAKSPAALREGAARLLTHLKENPDLDPSDVAYSLATTRALFEHRAVAAGAGRERLLVGLSALAAGRQSPGLVEGAAGLDAQPVFLFPGQGGQREGMALELYGSSPAFASHLDACERALEPYVDWSLSEILEDRDASWLDRLDIVQPALFAVMVSLARLWQDCGVSPAAVAGHSQGEIAAAHIAGGLSLDDAARIVALRSQAMVKIAGQGAMASVSLPEAALQERLEPYAGSLSLAAVNGPASMVVSGDTGAIEKLLASCERDSVRAQRIAVDYAAHSNQIEALREELLEAFAPIEPRSGEVPFFSTVSGEQIDTALLDGEYWYRNLRETVQLEAVASALLEQGRRAFIEVGPHPVLSFGVQETVDAVLEDGRASILSTLRRDEGSAERFALALAEAHAAGAKVEWSAFFAGSKAKRVPLPTYAFQRQRFWIEGASAPGDVGAAGQSAVDHPLLVAAIEDPEGKGLTLTGRISLQSHPWLKDHAVAGTVLLPGTALLELSFAAAERVGATAIQELTLEAPLILAEQGAVAIQVSVGEPDDEGKRQISIHSRAEVHAEDEESPEWTRHTSGTLAAEAPSPLEPLSAWPPPGVEALELADFYERLADAGFEYGPAFQGLSAAWRDGTELYAEVELASEQRDQAAGFGIHPALLDAALHPSVLAALDSDAEQSLRLPFSWSNVSLRAPGATALRVHLEIADAGISLRAYDQSGIAVAAVGALRLRPISAEQLAGSAAGKDTLFEVEWSEVELSGRGPSQGLAVVGDGALEAATALQSADVALDFHHSIEALPTAIADGAQVPTTLLCELSAPESEDLPQAARQATESALELVQAFLAAESLANSKLVLLTRGAIVAKAGESPDLTTAPLWGLLRSAQSEHPGRFALIDADGSEASLGALPAALELDEPQVALREGVALVPRVGALRDEADSLVPPLGPWQLSASKRASLEDLSLTSNPRATEPLAPGEVRVAMQAAGLNFRDVVVSLGFKVPGEGKLGSEGAGVVVEVGSEVDDLNPGDRVMGVIASAFGPLAVTERCLLSRLPDPWSFERGAAVPIMFLTAHYGLFDLAELKQGEKVLIHAGAGGVGMAAIQLAQAQGAEVFATASPAKWEVLEAAGLDQNHIASSRDLDFKEKFLKATNGEGVDVVLDSLAKEFVDASLQLLPNGGRFIEMGKTDIRDPEQLAQEHPGVAYRAFDLFEAGPERMGEMLSEIAQRFEAGELHHPPIATWDLRRAPEAFRHLREGRNVGKVVLTVPRAIDPDKTTLITGATGGLGSLVARHLVTTHGAKHLLLISRSGSKAKGAKELKAELEAQGAKVKLAACDVADEAKLKALLDKVPKAHPLGAAIHAAGALADGVIEQMDNEQIERVFTPKVDAAWNLHRLTKDQELSTFLCFSSIAGTLGGPGQANYAAANVFLDALAAKRQGEGLPAASVAWGLWAQASGMTSRLGDTDLKRLGRLGIEALSNEQGLELFDAALGAGRPVSLGIRLNRPGLRAQASAGTLAPILSGLVRTTGRRAPSGSLAARLSTLPEAEREPYVLDLVRAETAAVLGHASAEAIGSEKAFKDLGFDSLAAVELRNRLATATGLSLPATVVFDRPSPAKLAAHLLVATGAGDGTQRVAVRGSASDEPIAIVGMACRYPGGVASPEELWRLLADGGDAIAEFPADRGWDLERLYDPDPDSPGTSYSKEGGFLAGATDFDAAFFELGPREALAMDPQQRLLLEVCWEALEDAGLDPSSLAGSSTGVFAGISSQDYIPGFRAAGGGTEGYVLTGSVTSVASGRVAYSLGLEGPAMTIDTACSSSLVSLHLAAQALRSGECTLALAGGVTVLATPGIFTEFSRQRGLAPDGRCKPFSGAADGTGFAEGVGVLAVERLSEARRNGHPILATIRGSAVNQDGASNGLTAPNGPSQQRVIRLALANANLEPKDIDAVEAHGTGTTLGDPIEAQALLATYGQGRDNGPLKLGALKSNIGHTQAAAGVAGVIKMVLAMREGVLPKTLHVDEPSPHVDWDSGEIELLTEAEPWEPNGHPRRAGVSSFGISGTNAHLILEEAPALESGASAEPEPSEAGGEGTPGEDSPGAMRPLPGQTLLPLSAKSPAALREGAERLLTHLEANPELDPADVAYSLATTRALFEHRAVAVGGEREELLGALGALAKGESSPRAITAKAKPGSLAYLFTGQGSQRPGMGKELYEASPLFASHFEEICDLFDQGLEEPLQEVVFGSHPEAAELLNHTSYAQPALFALQVSLYRTLEALGLKPDLLAGHSIGELAAAHISGVLSIEDATKLVGARAALMGALPKGGAMAAIAATEQEVAESLQGKESEISIAAINGPTSVVVSGTEGAVEEIQSLWSDKGRKTKRLSVSHAFHSPLMEPMLEEFLEVAQSLTYAEPQIPIVSNRSGELLESAQATDPAYWVSQVREPVRFAEAIQTLDKQGAATYLELGPDPVLVAIAQEVLGEETEASFLATLRDKRPEAQALHGALAGAHASGAKLDWGAYFKGSVPKRVKLPTYAFQRERFWLQGSSVPGDARASGQSAAEHPLLVAAIESPESETLLLTGRLSLNSHPWLKDHAVAGTVLLPGTAFLELALHAAEQVGATEVKELTLQAPLILTEQGAVAIQVSVAEPDEEGNRQIAIHSRPESHDDEEEPPEWTRHASGTLSIEAPATPDPLTVWPPQGAQSVELADFYERLADAGFEYGPAFQGLSAAWRDGEELYAEVELASEQRDQAAAFGVHPALLDAALHPSVLAALDSEVEPSLRLPFSWSGVSLGASGATGLRIHLKANGEEVLLEAYDQSGALVVAVESLLMRSVSAEQLNAASASKESLFGVEWSEAKLGEATEPFATLGAIELSQGEHHQDIESLSAAIADGAEAPATILCQLSPPDSTELPEAARQATESALALVQAFLAAESLAKTKLALLTKGAIAARAGESPDLATAPLWGLLRSAQSEHPGRFALIDSDGEEASLAALPATLELDEPQVALREGAALAPRVTRISAPETEPELKLDPDRTALITGATGGLGSLVARHLVSEHGAKHLLLISRSGSKAKGAKELKAELEELGAKVKLAACDASDPKALKALLDKVPKAHPLGAAIHAAGALADGVIDSMTSEQIQTAFTPKVDAAWNLHRLTKDQELSTFLCFSSIAGTLGGPGQANYAAANVFLDALAAKRQGEGLAASSVAWGFWAQASAMTSQLGEADLKRLGRLGIEALSNQQGLQLFDAALGADRSLSLGIRLNRSGLRSQAAAGILAPILSGLIGVPARRVVSGSLAAKLSTLPAPEREPHVLELVRGEAAAVLGHASAEAIESGKAFQELGFDSLAAVELRNRLAVATGLSLPATSVFDYPTPAALASYLCKEASATASAPQVIVRSQASDEPVAIVGMACRYPGGVNSPAELWELVSEGRDGISEFPTDRGWDLERLYDPDPDAAGTTYTKEGGFLYDAGEFDADFFSISPREALAMDPQQRLLLEACWEALEDAGLDPSSLRGSPTGVFAGVMHHDYPNASGPLEEVEGYLGTGSAGSVASGRIAYSLGLEGPAMTIDTACSSSLVSLHLAAQALRSGECDLALAGGVTVLALPSVFTEQSRLRGLAPDGRSKSFAEAADGVGWSEGVGVLALARLSEAKQAGYPVLATIRGSAVNQDGASNGLTAPNGPSQERVIRQALANANLEPKDVDAVEAHGTGTTLGDPIEAQALLATYGQDRDNGPLKLGALKSNIGHTQAAAGVAGVIKMVLAMREGVLPKTLHVDEPSSYVDWEAGEVELLTEAQAWDPNGHPRRAGVSSFGISGTNAHLILEEAPAADEEAAGAAAAPPLIAWPISAHDDRALAGQASRLAAHLRAKPELGAADVGLSLAAGRAHLERRAVAIGADREELAAAVAALGEERPAPGSIRATAATAGKLALLFTGQGSQRAGMGRGLYRAFPAFAAAFDAACECLDPHFERPLRELVFADEGSEAAALLDRTEFAQAGLFALEVALYRLVESFGVRPDFLIGHSIGELSAAHVAGVWSLEDAARLVAARGQLMQVLPAGGAMFAVEASETEAAESIEGREREVGIAAVNGPLATVLSGDEPAVAEVAAGWRERGRRVKRLQVSHAFHSPRMEPMLEEFRARAEAVRYHEPRIPIVSGRTGEVADAAELRAPEHWLRNVRDAVRFSAGVDRLDALGVTTYCELGPGGELCAMARECLPEDDAEGVALAPALRRDRPEPATLVEALARVYVGGGEVEWSVLFAGSGARRVGLPTYAFQRRRFWIAPGAAASAAGAGQAFTDHALLGGALTLAEGDGRLLTGLLSLQTQPWLADHAVGGAVVLPGAAFVECALRAGREAGLPHLRELTIEAPLVVPGSGAVQLQVAVAEADESGARAVRIYSRLEDGAGEEGDWRLHAGGVLAAEGAELEAEADPAWPPAGATAVDLADLYEGLADRGLEYGPLFRGVQAAWRRGDELFAEVSLPPEQAGQGGRYCLHPALLDASLHGWELLAAAGDGEEAEAGDELRLPFAWTGVEVSSTAAAASSLRVRLRGIGGDRLSVSLADRDGVPVASVRSLATRPVSAEQLRSAEAGEAGGLFRQRWTPVAGGDSGGGGEPEFCSDPGKLARSAEAVPELVFVRAGWTAGDGPAAAGDGLPAAAHAVAQEALATVQAWLAEPRFAASRLVVVTRGAIAVDPAGEIVDLAAAPVWGLVRSAQSEHPRSFLLVDVDGQPSSLEAVAAACAGGEPQLAIRDGEVLVPRLERVEAAPAPGSKLGGPGTVLIAGGTGELGRLVARHLVEAHGVEHLLLASRSGVAAAGVAELERELTGLGATVTVAACELEDREQVRALIASVPGERPLRGVIHAAGILEDGVVEGLAPAQLDRVLAPKVDAAWHLHEATAGLDLAEFVLFSSAAGVFGGAGQANYVAANAFLDALASRRRADGLAATSLAWGLWEQGRGVGEADGGRTVGAGVGVAPLSADRGLELFDLALGGEETLALPLRLDTAALRARARAGTLPAPLRGLVRAPARASRVVVSLRERLAALPEERHEDAVLGLVRTEVAAVLGHASPASIGREQPFKALGFDSLAAVELRNRLGIATGLRIAPTVVFDHPSSAELASYLLGEARPGGPSAGADGPADARTGVDFDDEDEDLAEASDDELFEYLDREAER